MQLENTYLDCQQVYKIVNTFLIKLFIVNICQHCIELILYSLYTVTLYNSYTYYNYHCFLLLLYIKVFQIANIFQKIYLEGDFPFKTFCIPESFNTNISHQLFDYTITFVNTQHYNTNSKGDFVLKNRF